MAKKIVLLGSTNRVWDIEGFPQYFFGDDKCLYRYDARGVVRRNKRVVLRYTQGYVLKGRFYSLKQLRPMLRRHQPTNNPEGF